MGEQQAFTREQLDEVLKKKVTRKEFIKYVFFGAVSMVGIGHFLLTFYKKPTLQNPQVPSKATGSHFGGSKFGV